KPTQCTEAARHEIYKDRRHDPTDRDDLCDTQRRCYRLDQCIVERERSHGEGHVERASRVFRGCHDDSFTYREEVLEQAPPVGQTSRWEKTSSPHLNQ